MGLTWILNPTVIPNTLISQEKYWVRFTEEQTRVTFKDIDHVNCRIGKALLAWILNPIVISLLR